ncbi:nitrite/Sulfite reductase ferredoxin-like half domain protein [Mycobacterium ulcerans str. Harvey]|uniref:Nitrite/Sulfite reductase ferredoxin-like half domain protein n=1 Tax=Mycobacterium ulcerans str. Harvey TaxID=1299332 RepID=A0ABN0QS51_MYCUL|nr:nitrite/Sulfite reductase ferredoxin-like half domain protein [Mycobacterium ulcerans str. Harvey]
MTTARPAKPRNEGQWALGNREPFNANEELKKAGNPLDVRERIENIYAKAGFDSIDKSDLRGLFRWWGLYTQREQGYDGSWTGDENIDKLEAKYFMLRVRCDGGALSTAALRTLGAISTEFARDTADISDRENLQYHWIEVEKVPEIWRRLDEVGLHTTEACGDCPASCWARHWPASHSTRCWTRLGRSTKSCAATSASLTSPTCHVSTRPRSRACRTLCTRSTMSRSSASTTPSTGRGWICG